MPIRFLRDYTVQDRERTTYAKDEVRDDLSPASEQHFVSRNAASFVEAGGSKPKTIEPDQGKTEKPQPQSRKRTKRTAS